MPTRLRACVVLCGFAALTLAAFPLEAHALERVITTRYGNADPDGPAATTAVVESPGQIVVDSHGRVIFGDMGLNLIRRLDPALGTVETLAGNGLEGNDGDGGPPLDASLDWPMGIALDEARGLLYFCDFGHHDVRVVNFGGGEEWVANVRVAAGTVERIAGLGVPVWEASLGDGGPAVDGAFAYPRALALDSSGNVYVADIDTARVRKIDQLTGILTTVAGNGEWAPYPGDHGDGGLATDAKVLPTSVAVDAFDVLYIGDAAYNRALDRGLGLVRRVDLETGEITTVAGNGVDAEGGDGNLATAAGLIDPPGLTFDDENNLFIADRAAVRRVDAVTKKISTVAGHPGYEQPFVAGPEGGAPRDARFVVVQGLAFHAGSLFLGEAEGGALRRVDPGSDGRVTGDDPEEKIYELPEGIALRGGLKWPQALAADRDGTLYVGEWWHGRIHEIDRLGGRAVVVGVKDVAGWDGEGGPAAQAQAYPPAYLATDEDGNVYFADGRLVRVNAIDGRVQAGSTLEKLADLPFVEHATHGVAVGGGKVFVSELFGHRVWSFNLATGELAVAVGTGVEGTEDGPLSRARLVIPCGLAYDARRDILYVSDPEAHNVRKVDFRTRQVSTIFALPSGFEGEQFSNNEYIALLGEDLLFVADSLNQVIYRLDVRQRNPEAEVVAGTGYDFPYGFEGDGVAATTTELGDPRQMAFDPAGKLLVTERFTGRVRQIGVTDIAPGEYPNDVNLSSPATVRVAILASYAFDPATELVAESVRVAGAPVERLPRHGAAWQEHVDVNGDGRPDLVLAVRQDHLDLAPHALEAAITADRHDGGTFRDADWVTVHPGSRAGAGSE